MTNTTTMVVAETILAQLGGRKFILMTGAKNLVGGERELGMKLGSGAQKGITHLRIVLDASDTYTVTFLRIRGAKVSTVHEATGVYAENLRDVFTAHTGFYTTL